MEASFHINDGDTSQVFGVIFPKGNINLHVELPDADLTIHAASPKHVREWLKHIEDGLVAAEVRQAQNANNAPQATQDLKTDPA